MPEKVHRAARALLAVLAHPARRERRRRERRARRAAERADVPVLERLVEAAGHEALAIRRERDAVHAIRVPVDALDECTGGDVLDTDHGINRARGDEPAVWADRNTRHVGVGHLIFIGGKHMYKCPIDASTDAKSHTRAVLSPEPETSNRPSREYSSAYISF